MDKRTAIISKIKNRELHYKDIPEELKRHTQARINKYEEQTESVQFIKCYNEKLEKEIFKPFLNPLIIIIGNERNEIAKKIVLYKLTYISLVTSKILKYIY